MSGWNLPPGVSDYDLPGYCEIEVTISVHCDTCGQDGDLEDITVDSRGGSEWEAECPNPECSAILKGMYEPDDDYDYDDRWDR